MEQLTELQAHLHRLPVQLASSARLDDALQHRLHAVSLALRALSDLESDRLGLERAHQRIATLSQAVTGEWASEIARQTAPPASAAPKSSGDGSGSGGGGSSSLTRSFSSSAALAGSNSPSYPLATPSKLLASPSSLLSGSPTGQRDAALRQALGKEAAGFAEAYGRALGRFDANWSSASRHALKGHQADEGWLGTAPRPRHRQGKGANAAAIGDGPTPLSGWIGPNTPLGDSDGAGATALPTKDASLLLKVLRFGIGNLRALASSIIRASVSDRSGGEASHSQRLSPEDVAAAFGVVIAARGTSAALELAEHIFVRGIKQSDQLDGREADLLFMTVLDILHAADLREQGDDVAACERDLQRDPLAPSPALEIELLAFLEECRRRETTASPRQLEGFGRRPSHPLSAELSASIWPRSATAPLSALGSSAADAWNASLHSGMTTISGLLTAGGNIGSKLIGRAGTDASHAVVAGSEKQSEATQRGNEQDPAATPQERLSEDRKDDGIKVPPTLSVSRFVKPTTGAAATTAGVHAERPELSAPGGPSGDSDAKHIALGSSSAFKLLGASAMGGPAAQVSSASMAAVGTAKSPAKDAHSALEAIAAASGSPSPEASPFRPRPRRIASSGQTVNLAAKEAEPADPVTAFAPRVLQILIGGSASGDEKTAGVGARSSLPLACRLSNRLLRKHFPASEFPEESRKIRLVIVVRWFAFTVLRDLITHPENLGRSLRGGKLLWAAHSTRLPVDDALSYEDLRDATADKGIRGFEDVWTSDEVSCRALNGLHRALYSGIVKCARVSSVSPVQFEQPEQPEGLAAGCRRLLDLFGADYEVHNRSSDAGFDAAQPAPATEAKAFSLSRNEALAFTQASVLGFLDAACCNTRVAPATGESGAPHPSRRHVERKDVESLLEAIRESTRPGKSADSTDAYDLPLLYAAFDSRRMKACVSTSLSEVDCFVEEAQQALAQRPRGDFSLSLDRTTFRRPTQASTDPDPDATTKAQSSFLAADIAGPSSGFSVASSSAQSEEQADACCDWESPPCSPFAEKTLDSLFQLDANVVDNTRRDGAATPKPRCADPAVGSIAQTFASVASTSRASPVTNAPTHVLLQQGHDAGSSTGPSGLSHLPVEEVRRGMLALIRRGYSTRSAPSLPETFEVATRRAEEHENFVDAVLFRQTAAVLRYCSRAAPSLISAPGRSSGTDFAPLAERILLPFRDEVRKCESHQVKTQARLSRLEGEWTELSTKARILLSSLQELRTRCWYACEIRTSPEVASSIMAATLGLHGHHDHGSDERASGEPNWFESLGIHDLSLPADKASFVQGLDPAFQKIVRDAGSFFSSPLWSREALLAKPFLSSRKRRGNAAASVDAEDLAIFTFGVATKALLQAGELPAEPVVGLETFLQRVQLAATGLLLSEAMAMATQTEAVMATTNGRDSSAAAGRNDPDKWVRAFLGRVEGSLQHRDPELASKLSSSGVDRLLQRFDHHPSPHHKMRALFNITRLVVTQLSLVSVPEAPAAAAQSAAAAGGPSTAPLPPPLLRDGLGHLPRRSNASHHLSVVEGGKRASIWHSRRSTTASSVHDPAGAAAVQLGSSPTAGGTCSPARISLASRPSSIGGLSNGPRRARRALSMYVDDDLDEEDAESRGAGTADDDDDETGPRGGMPNIHDLLSLMDFDGTQRDVPSTGTDHFAAPPLPTRPAAALPLQQPEPPSTDTLLNVLESVLIHTLSLPASASASASQGRLKNVYLHLQLICAFSPTAILDWKEEGKALWDAVLAASSVRSEVASRNLDLVRSGRIKDERQRQEVVEIARGEGIDTPEAQLPDPVSGSDSPLPRV
ncbi:uncharacterized protein PFL1_03632 [Pseudozyma flocculosa PF-1]|uniref:Uncharacterized protein n=1 Tax=Pseudozyma flocculosa PF-1 TaxID=1277687 RepID=A0A061H8N6_9BASI|nr:uncharacterized protein PFL1_03632 [Pseudozyma flocculosa PF-1]EPQ28829.1 hypothetical protein PFL1_03632 [Pseudozyma flocculosa PF-1]